MSASIEGESLGVRIVYATISDGSLVSEELIDLDSFSFSLYSNRIEFSEFEEITDLSASSLRYDHMIIVFFASCLEARCEIHDISENRVVEVIDRPDIANHHISTRDTNTEAQCLDSLCSDLSVDLWENSHHLNRGPTGSHGMI